VDRIALITGITGQDGSYLAEYLLSKGYEVHGIIRRSSSFNTGRIDHIFQDQHEKDVKLILHYGDIGDFGRISGLIRDIQPDEVYNLAAQSHVKVSFDMPEYTGQVTGLGTICILEALRKNDQDSRFYQASSSEMFGAASPPQSESTQFHPRSPYAVAKVYSYWITVNYREAYGMHASNGILFNHESPRRGGTFVTKKITNAIAKIKSGRQKYVYLGNLNAKRDWGFAPEYLMGMYDILQLKNPTDLVLATGNSISVQDFLNLAFEYAGLDPNKHVKIDPKYFRPSEVEYLEGDPSKAKKLINWAPKVEIGDLAKIMVDFDFLSEGIQPIGEGIDLMRKLGMDWTQIPKME